MKVEEFAKNGVVYEKNGVKVIGFEVHHGDLIKPSAGYRIGYKGHCGAAHSNTDRRSWCVALTGGWQGLHSYVDEILIN